jgi:hypothetical protein
MVVIQSTYHLGLSIGRFVAQDLALSYSGLVLMALATYTNGRNETSESF